MYGFDGDAGEQGSTPGAADPLPQADGHRRRRKRLKALRARVTLPLPAGHVTRREAGWFGCGAPAASERDPYLELAGKTCPPAGSSLRE